MNFGEVGRKIDDLLPISPCGSEAAWRLFRDRNGFDRVAFCSVLVSDRMYTLVYELVSRERHPRTPQHQSSFFLYICLPPFFRILTASLAASLAASLDASLAASLEVEEEEEEDVDRIRQG